MCIARRPTAKTCIISLFPNSHSTRAIVTRLLFYSQACLSACVGNNASSRGNVDSMYLCSISWHCMFVEGQLRQFGYQGACARGLSRPKNAPECATLPMCGAPNIANPTTYHILQFVLQPRFATQRDGRPASQRPVAILTDPLHPRRFVIAPTRLGLRISTACVPADSVGPTQSWG